MTLDLNLPYTCRNGSEAGATKGPDGYYYGFVKVSAGDVRWAIWTIHGEVQTGDSLMGRGFDLINTPQRRTLDVWAIPHSRGLIVQVTRAEAEQESERICQMSGPVWAHGCIHIVQTYTDGEGLT